MGSENGWANVSEECFFSVFDETADMRAGHILYVHTHLLTSIAYKHTDEFMTVCQRCDMCACEWAVGKETGQGAPGDVVYPTD